ncbi:Enhancer of polycomb-like protein [Elsinoe fawcettii]|nr:Enhancer of polycomb-like protein [Elsinoe fawcettii]
MTSRTAGARFRQRKLSTKHALSIIREEELLDSYHDEDDPSRQIPKLETGVEKSEETEHHLQAVITASAAASLGGKAAQVYIPTPEVKSSHMKYDELYPPRFSSPTTYIRFSSTVEDCIGPLYCSTNEDDAFLSTLNTTKIGKDGRLTIDCFEEVMSFFESAASTRQPYANIDNPPVLAFEELQASYDDTISPEAQKWAPEVYPHWHSLRLAKGNRSLMPNLKSETGAETDDSDAYVCFRRREVRQARKTRGRDAQVTEKLRKLRRELEDARQLVHSINAREKLFLDRIDVDRKVFEQRQELKRVKIQHGIKGDKDDEDLLINQRPAVKPKMKLDMSGQRPAMLKLSAGQRPDARGAPEQDLVQLEDIREEAEAVVRRAVETKKQKHRDWNRGFRDDTWYPLCPPDDERPGVGFLPVVREVQLPTPPASVGDKEEMDIDRPTDRKDAPKDLPTPESDAQPTHSRSMFQFSSPPGELKRSLPAFRRRYGRLGRLHIDAVKPRRVLPAEQSGVVYDSDSDMEIADSDDDVVVYPVDYWGTWNINYRASLMSTSRKPEQQQAPGADRRSSSAAGGAPDVVMGNGAGTAGG